MNGWKTFLLLLVAVIVFDLRSAAIKQVTAQQACPVPTAPTVTMTISPFTGTPPQGGSPVDCTIPPPPPPPPPPPTVINGVCGADNGIALSSPPTNLCNAGAATVVSGTGPWVWQCLGSGGGTNATCNATLAVGPPPPPPPPPTIITIGETTVFPTTDNGNANLLLEQDVTLTQAGTLQSLSFYVSSVNGMLRLGFYDDAGNIIVQTAAFAPSLGWNTRAISPTPLTPGRYWLANAPSSNSLAFPVERQSGTTRYVTRTFSAMPPTFPASPTVVTSHWSFYATLSVP